MTLPNDPSSVPNEFARRLELAIRERNLTLSRLRSHLVARGLEVSVATLSYWTTGRSRPMRARSMATLTALEELLELPPGHLLEALPAERAYHSPTSMLPHGSSLAQALDELGLPRSSNRRRLLIHDRTLVGSDGIERHTTSEQVLRAEVDRLERWAIIVHHEPDQHPEVEPVAGLRLGESVRLPEHDMLVVEALLPRALQRGESIGTTHRVVYQHSTRPTSHFGRALNRNCDALVLEAHFEGEPPRQARRRFVTPGGSELPVGSQSLYLTGHQLQAVVPSAVAGTHIIEWDC